MLQKYKDFCNTLQLRQIFLHYFVCLKDTIGNKSHIFVIFAVY